MRYFQTRIFEGASLRKRRRLRLLRLLRSQLETVQRWLTRKAKAFLSELQRKKMERVLRFRVKLKMAEQSIINSKKSSGRSFRHVNLNVVLFSMIKNIGYRKDLFYYKAVPNYLVSNETNIIVLSLTQKAVAHLLVVHVVDPASFRTYRYCS